MLNLDILDGTNSILIGKGTFGEVSQQKYAGTRVAVKKIASKVDLELEVYNLSVLTHPNIVTMLGFNRELIVMELADGTAKKIPSYLELSIVGRDCMKALSYMHMHGNCIMHADIKPENVLVFKNKKGRIDRAVLGDIGLARACNSSGHFLGTPGYMPQDDIAVSGFDDIFALAVTLLDSNHSFHHDKVHTTYTGKYENDNTIESAEMLGTMQPELGEILKYMLMARKSTEYRSIPLKEFMLSLINAFENLVDKYSPSPSNFRKLVQKIKPGQKI